MNVYLNLVREGLAELSDLDFQSRVWTGETEGVFSTFVECIEQIYTDSGLERELEAGSVFDHPLDDRLRSLSILVAKIDDRRSPREIIEDPLMKRVRDMAAESLTLLNEHT